MSAPLGSIKLVPAMANAGDPPVFAIDRLPWTDPALPKVSVLTNKVEPGVPEEPRLVKAPLVHGSLGEPMLLVPAPGYTKLVADTIGPNVMLTSDPVETPVI